MPKFIEILKKKVTKAQTDLSEGYVNAVMTKRLYDKSKRYKPIINEKFYYFLDNYVTVCKYLHDEFNVKKTILNGEMTSLEEELDLKEKSIKILKEYPNRKTRFMDKFNMNRPVKKWWILSSILECYPDALNELKNQSKQGVYKGININQELDQVEKYKYLIEDFSIIEK